MEKLVSFKEEPYHPAALTDAELAALSHLKSLLPAPPPTLYFRPATDVILLKFLRARDLDPVAAHRMLRRTLQWRQSFLADPRILSGPAAAYDLACFYCGADRSGRPVCYNVLGVFSDEKAHEAAFGDEAKRKQFVRWRVGWMESGVGMLELGSPDGPASMVQVVDLKDSPGLGQKEVRSTLRQLAELMQDHYPEFVTKNIFINVPFRYYAFIAFASRFCTQRTRSKFVFARPPRVAEILHKYIPIWNIPTAYGGLHFKGDSEFAGRETDVSELIVQPNCAEAVNFHIPKAATCLIWDLTVVGWDVHYKEEFVPSDEGSYTILIQAVRKAGSQHKPIRNSFINNEPGKVVLTIENSSSRNKTVCYRWKAKQT